MSRRASMFGTGGIGTPVEYRGDVTPPVQSYASSYPGMPMTSRLYNPPSTNLTKSAVVARMPRRGGHIFFYSHGAVPMRKPLPGAMGAVAAGGVESSLFQPYNVQLMDWQNNTSWHESGYPRNLGLSTRVPQVNTNVTGGTGKSSMDQRPLFTRVQTVPRATVRVANYPTKGTTA